MELIQSKQNPKLKQWKKLLTAKGRDKQGAYLIEGTHLVEEALKANQPLECLIMTSDYDASMLPLVAHDLTRYYITAEIARELSATPQPQGVFAIVSLPDERDANWQATGTRYLLVDAVQDPGNLGTLIRTADAAGFDGVLLGKGTVDVYNDKTLRATQGSLWHLEVVRGDLLEMIAQLQAQQIPVYATALHQGAQSYRSVEVADKVALIVGNEGNGVANNMIQVSDQSIYIPMAGQAESLNVAIAAGILMFHWATTVE